MTRGFLAKRLKNTICIDIVSNYFVSFNLSYLAEKKRLFAIKF